LPAQTEGPYFTDERLERSDIRSDPLDGTVRPGTPLELTFSIFDASTPACVPVSGALVDLWQCDAGGLYAGVQSLGTAGHEFLRGFQRTSGGVAQFLTIYPGWYPGRTLHLHFKVRHTDASGFVRSFTSQLYFPEPVNDAVMASGPYDARGARSVRNTDDAIFRAGGEALVVPVEPAGTGYTGAVNVGVLL
jgi:protocatechuate 3,4-dioxygenase beta subunit